MSMVRLTVGLLPFFFGSAFGQEQAPPKPITQARSIATINRICVDMFVGNPEGLHARELAIASIFTSKAFSVTEKCESAEATLKGAISLSRGSRTRSEGDAVQFGKGARATDAQNSVATGAIGGTDERLYSSETRENASVALRLVDSGGEVIWAYSVDSTGGKVKGALSDAVEQAVKQLLRDIERGKKIAGPPAKK